MIDLLDRHLIFALLKTPQKRRRNIVIISCTNINKDVCIYIYNLFGRLFRLCTRQTLYHEYIAVLYRRKVHCLIVLHIGLGCL